MDLSYEILRVYPLKTHGTIIQHLLELAYKFFRDYLMKSRGTIILTAGGAPFKNLVELSYDVGMSGLLI